MTNEQGLEIKKEVSMTDGIKRVQELTEQLRGTDPQKDSEGFDRIQKELKELNDQGFEVPLGTRND